MKQLTIISILLAMSINAMGQKIKKEEIFVGYNQNYLSILYSPEDNGVGLLYSLKHKNVITHAGISYGNYRVYLKNHIKTYTGIGYYFFPQGHFSIMLHYNYFEKEELKPQWFNDDAMKPFTLGLCGGVSIDGTMLMIQYDIIQRVGSFSFGILIK
ncbi:hypothetical protein ES705_29053 [subsurface metagenome]